MSHFPIENFSLSPEDKGRLHALHSHFQREAERHLGFPGNLNYDYKELLDFFSFTINNVGDPFAKEGIYKIHTHTFEQEVISFFAELFHITEPYWGYVTNGGTEGNYHGLYLARQMLPNGVVYYSKSAHYSLPKAARFMNLRFEEVSSEEASGEMDYEALEYALRKHSAPAIILATIGTTMTGAVDSVEHILDVLQKRKISDFYIHSDAALAGMVLPFLHNAPLFDFRLPIDSISVSGHKMIGSPVPCGIVLTKKKYIDWIQSGPEITGSPDFTISGSRNGHTVLFLWYAIKKYGFDGFASMVRHCFRVHTYALHRLREAGVRAWAGEHTTIIMLEKPADHVCRKWQLAVTGGQAHIIVMPNITEEHIDRLVDDLIAS